MRNWLLFVLSSIVICSHAEVNDSIDADSLYISIMSDFLNKYDKSLNEGIHYSIVEVDDSIYINVVRDLCTWKQYGKSKGDTIFVFFDDKVSFKNFLFIENEIQKMPVRDNPSNNGCIVYTVNEAIADEKYCLITITVSNLNEKNYSLIIYELIYYLYKREKGKYILKKRLETSF